MANISYVRVSTKEQNTGRQDQCFKDRGITIDRGFVEKVSGKSIAARPQLKELLNYVRGGDTLYIESISRLARNTRDFLDIVEQLQNKGVELVSIKEQIDTGSPQGRFMLNVFASLSQLERELIRERQREGIDLALAEGRAYGRPKATISDTFKTTYKDWKADKITAVEAMRREGLTKTTFYKLVKEFESKAAAK